MRQFELKMKKKEREDHLLTLNDERCNRDGEKFVSFRNNLILRWLDLDRLMNCVSLEED